MQCPECDKFVCCARHAKYEHKKFHGEKNE